MLNNLKYRIFSNWSFMRFLRFGLAAFVLVEALMNTDLLFGALGGFVLLQALLNVGCCSTLGCDVNHATTREKSPDKGIENTTFTEVE